MKLLMENWRKFVAETEPTKNCGDLYLFENDSIQKASFYDRFSTLNESDDDFELFLEQWEKSVDYQLGLLSEGIRDDRGRTWTSKDEAEPGEAFRWGSNAEWKGRKLTPEDMGLTQQEADYLEDFREKFLAARGTPQHPYKDPVADELLKKSNQHMAMSSLIPFFTQGYMLLQRGGQAVGKVLSVANKLKQNMEKKGLLGKVGAVALTGLVASATLIGIKAIMDSGGDAGEVAQKASELADAAAVVEPDVGQALEQATQNPESAAEVLGKLEQAAEQTTQQLSQVDNEAVKQVAQEAEKSSQQYSGIDDFSQMFEDSLRQDRTGSDAEIAQQAADSTQAMPAEEVQEWIDYWGTYRDGRPTYMNTVEQGWAYNSGLEDFTSFQDSYGIGLPENMESGNLSKRDMRSLVRDFIRTDYPGIMEYQESDPSASWMFDDYVNHYLGLGEEEASKFRKMFNDGAWRRRPYGGGGLRGGRPGPIGRGTPVDFTFGEY